MGFAGPEEIVEHYIHKGWQAGFDPSPTFQSARYLEATPGLRETGENPFTHYLFQVVGEDALIQAFDHLHPGDIAELRAHFDADWYGLNNPDVATSGHDPLVHYMTSGWRELRDPTPNFSTGAYLHRYLDIRDCGINPLYHWVFYGIGEGRLSGPLSPLEMWQGLTGNQRSIITRMFELDYYHKLGAEIGFARDPSLVGAGDPTVKVDGAASSFRASKFVAAHPGMTDTPQSPLLHYLFGIVGEDALHELFVAQPPEILSAFFEHFDTAWYLYSYPDVEASGEDAFIHYMTVGWREYRDPSQEFSTRAYLLRYPDIVAAGVNPLLHWIAYGQAEGRSGASSASSFRNRPYAPSITAILINSGARPLTPEEIAAIEQQSYADLTILVAGAPLSGDCRAALDNGDRNWSEGAFSHPQADRSAFGTSLQRTVESAPGDLLWFVQPGVIHDREFLARLASSFADNSVQLGFGRRLEVGDIDYAVSQDELARRMERWVLHVATPAALWFAEHLKPEALAADQHSFLWRRRKLGDHVWREADNFQVLGIWYLYLHMASGGQIATVRDAVMRIPFAAALPNLDQDDSFRLDRARLITEVQSFWSVPSGILGAAPKLERTKRHLLIVTHGLFAGGAENLPIQMANALVARGVIVSLLIFKVDVNPEMRATLDPGISIFEADWVMEYGCDRFIRDAGFSLIHSHGVIGEMFFFRLCEEKLPIPYVSTLHGSYEASSSTELPESFIAKIVRNVDLFIYTADKNLGPLLRHDVHPDRVIKMINAMPVDPVPFPRSRAELGIAEDAIVFTLIARGIPEKGWSTAINAFKAVQRRNPHRPVHLCLVGEGDEPDRLCPLHADDPSISFLGFQLRIHGLYRLTDVAIAPTRFAGESFPLCIIQALQVGVPIVSTNVGEIAAMLDVDGVVGGVVVEADPVDARFDALFTDAMHCMVDDDYRMRMASGARVLGERYDMGAFTDKYVAIYENVLRKFALPQPAVNQERVE